MNEFELISRFFQKAPQLKSTRLAVGDDCALLNIASNKVLATSIDAMVEGVHFFKDSDPYLLAQKALAVNLSDLAAIGAKPLAFLLSLTLPNINEAWLAQFSKGLFETAEKFQIDLIGGNTTQGPLNINITVMGEVDETQALRRDRAKADDDIFVTGTLGGAALGLKILQQQAPMNEAALARFNTPIPRVQLAQDLLGLAHAAIDISDGLAQDLGHILAASGVGAKIYLSELPAFPGADLELALNGGEDYELCFTAPIQARNKIAALAQQHQVNITRIGNITQSKKLEFFDANHQKIDVPTHGYRHF